MACTAVVERTVHGHLVDQAAFLDRFDPALASLVREIPVEEDDHLAFAEARHDETKPAARLISAAVSALTEALIALSTRGDSWRLSRDLKAAAG